MNGMSSLKFVRLVRLLKASNHAIPLDVMAWGTDEGHAIDAYRPAPSYDPRELSDLLVLAGIDPADVIHSEILAD
jgi:hypothetical protein